ncbi:VOC family protein [Mycobacteroides salmoniphilum]|uniref:VOC family protein n=1 Tax=Mycobacteroides salmoniphilum TaxID=404941 RepID=UPI001781475C|nr:VOC family protein [Mycobacteroides salmoniphilum]
MTDNVASTVDFYQRAFGLGVSFEDPDGTFVVLNYGSAAALETGVLLAVEHWDKISDYADRGPANGFRLGFHSADVPVAYERAIAAGAVGLLDPVYRPWKQWVAAVRDPNGAIVEIAGPTEYK